MDKHINIITTNKCQLRCSFCINSLLNGNFETDEYNYAEFVITLEKLLDFGFNVFDLTPNVGDVFLDPEFMKKVTYLENNERVERYEFVTNFLAASNNDIYQLTNTRKCECAISIYGYDIDTYKQTTGIDDFKCFLGRLNILLSKTMEYENAEPFMFYMRYSKFEDIPNTDTKKSIQQMMKWGATLENAETVNRNWGGMMKNTTGEKQGICSRILAENGVYPNGDITACNCWDWNKEMLIGNLNEQTLQEIYSKESPFGELLSSQFKNEYKGPCIKCDDFVQVHKYDLQIPWTKIYDLFYK